MTKVSIADKNTLLSEGIKLMIENTEGLKFVEIYSAAESLERKLSTNPTDILILDENFKQSDTLDLIDSLKSSFIRLSIIMLGDASDPILVNKMLDVGIQAYVSKTGPLTELENALAEVRNGQIYLCPMTEQAMKEVFNVI